MAVNQKYGYARTRSILALFGCALAACQGSIEEPGRGQAGAGALPSVGASGHSGGLITPAGPAACTPGMPPVTTRLARLTRRQYSNSIRDLTGLDLDASADFLPDPHQASFDRGLDLQVGDVLARAYRDAAESVAEKVVADASVYRKVVGCDPAQGDSCARTFIAGFGKKALRRPLSSAEQSSYFTLFKQGPSLYDAGDDFHRGVRVTLEALLQSPKFLYRVELSDKADHGLIALSGYETATRLSCMLVNSTPDDALLMAADGNQLATPEAVAMQAKRLLGGQHARSHGHAPQERA